MESLTFLHAAGLLRCRWDGPLEGLQDGHPGLRGRGASVSLGKEGMGIQPPGSPCPPSPASCLPNPAFSPPHPHGLPAKSLLSG